MKIVNEKTIELGSSLDAIKESVGIIIGDRDDTGKNTLKLYIPRLMMGISLKEASGKAEESDESIDSSIFKNSKNKNIGANSIKIKNYMEIPPYVIPGVSLPRFVKGERVVVHFADNDIKNPVYMPYQIKDDIKRKNDIMRIYAPSKEKEDDPMDDDNTYFMEINTKEKFVRLKTTNKDGEKCPFTYNINSKDGIVTFKDDSEKRMFEWNYDEDKLFFGTDGGVEFEMKEAAVKIKCETYEIDASKSIKMKTSKFLLESNQGDLVIDNMFVKNTSFEQKATMGKFGINSFDVSGNLAQITAQGLFLNAPATINTGMSIFAGFYITGMAAPGPLPSIYSGGALSGASPASAAAAPKPKEAKADSSSPGSKKQGDETDTDMKGKGRGKPLAYAEPVKKALNDIAKQADKAVGMARFHMHPGDYIPLAPLPMVPAVEKPLAMLEMTAFIKTQIHAAQIPATKFKA